jgi:hypothetical protein
MLEPVDRQWLSRQWYLSQGVDVNIMQQASTGTFGRILDGPPRVAV